MALLRVALAVVASLIGMSASSAQDFPSKPITIISPFTSGGTSDLSSRIYAQIVAEQTGQRVIVENKPGGGGVVAALQVKDARPDGYTLFLANLGSNAILENVTKLTYDPINDFESVSELFFVPHVLSVPASINVKTVAELRELAAKKPGGLSYGSQGVGTGGHLLGAMLQGEFKTPMQHIAYRGGAPMTVDLVAGRIDISFGSYFSIKQYVAEGKLRMPAVASAKRWVKLPDLPTLTEMGVPHVELDAWFGLVAPKGTPAAVIERLQAEFAKASQNPLLRQKLDEIDVTASIKTPAEFKAFMVAETKRLGEVTRANNVRSD